MKRGVICSRSIIISLINHLISKHKPDDVKHTFSILVLFFTFGIAFGQQTTVSKEAYLIKSKNQKTAAWIMLGGGTLLFIGGMIAHSNYLEEVEDPFEPLTEVSTGELAAFIGVLAAAGSIPLFIASSRNKRKAMSISLKNESAKQVNGNSLAVKYIPSVCLKLTL
jgi:hypothetical protein